MVIMTTHRPAHWQSLPDRPLTVDDLDQLPDEDGYRYELVDGRLEVSPRPSKLHSRVQARLVAHLAMVAPDDFEIHAETDFELNAEGTHDRIPDVAVLRTTDMAAERATRVAPPLVAEIISPSSAYTDYQTKAREYARFGIRSYWIIEPHPYAPTLLELRLDDQTGRYRELTQVKGEELFQTDVPFPVRIVPYWLVADGPWRELIGGDASG